MKQTTVMMGATCFQISVFPTTHGPAWWSGPLYVGMRLPFGSIHNSPPKDTFQLFGVWRGDGVATNGQLHQGQTHAPHVRLNGVVSALQSLRLLRNIQSTSVRAGRAKMRGRREVWVEGSVRQAQEVEERIKAGGEVVGGVMARSVRVWWGKEDGRAWQELRSSYRPFLLKCGGRTGMC